jgi:hypothetical protein
LQIGLVKDNADLWMPLFHNDLARRVRELGYGIRREKETGIVGFAIAGIPRSLVKKFSPRRATIEAAMDLIKEAAKIDDPEENERLAEKLGISEPWRMKLLQEARKKGLEAELKAELAVITRKHKQKNLSREELWNFMQRQLSPEDRAVLAKARGLSGWQTTDADAARYAMEHLFHSHNVVAEKKLVIEALRYGVGSVTLDGVKRELKRQGVMVENGQATTEAVRQEERVIWQFSRDGRGKWRPVVAESFDLEPFLQVSADIRLGNEQEGVMRDLAYSRNAVNLVDAGQGTGKTTFLEQFGKLLAQRQVRSTWLGTTITAVDELKARGLPAMTVAHFLHSKDEQRKAIGTRIILDESSMLAHKDAYQLSRYAAANDCRIDYVGDSKQYKSPVAGDTMGLLKRYGGIAPITMTKTMRQTGRLKDAMEAIRDGEVKKGHDILCELGFVHEIPLGQLTQKAADLYLRWSANGTDVPVISPTHAQGNEIAAKIREGLRERGDIEGDDKTIRRLVPLGWSPAQVKDGRENGVEEGVTLVGNAAYREETQALAMGDLVRTIMRGKSKDGAHEFKNGQKYAIAGFTRDDDPILNNGWVIEKNSGALVQRYVRTGQGGQGITADPRAIVVYGTPSLVATRQEGFYVPCSRVRSELAVLTDSNAALRQAIQKQDVRKFATELFQGGERQKTGLRERLKCHLSAMRRRLAFQLARERSMAGPELSYSHGL